MGWVRVDDDFYDHHKFVELSLAGMGLWIGLLAWSNRNLKDGCIPHAIPVRLGATQDVVQELLEVGLLEEGNDCLVIHDYHDFQPSAEEVTAKRDELAAKRAEAGRKGAASRWQADGNEDGKPITNVCPQPQPQLKIKNTPAATPTETFKADFETWWQGWPKKLDKKDARANYTARRRQGITAEALTAARDNYLATNPTPQFTKYGGTFLSGADGSWSEYLDGIPAGASTRPAPPPKPEPVRPILGRGVDAEPIWDFDEHGNAVKV